MSKQIEGKYRPSLTYTSLLKEISKVREYGIKKYGSSEDWMSTDNIHHYEAAIRHIRQHIDGEFIDIDSGILHLSHAIANIMFEIERIYRVNHDKSSSNNNKPRKIIVVNGKQIRSGK